MPKPRENAAILRRVAVMTVRDARKAWKRAHDSPSEVRLRAAFRACVLAARMLKKAAVVSPDDAAQILEEAERVTVTANELKAKLVRYIEGEIPATAKE